MNLTSPVTRSARAIALRAWIAACIAVALATAPAAAPEALAQVPARLLLSGTVVTMDGSGTVLDDGHVLVEADRIIAVWAGPTAPAGVDTTGARPVDTGPDSVIFPGLMDIHHHPLYAMQHAWATPSTDPQPDQGRPTGTEPYAASSQWNDDPPVEFARLVGGARAAITDRTRGGREADAMRFAEARALLAGTTTISGGRKGVWDQGGARNAENAAFRADNVANWVPGVDSPDLAEQLPSLRQQLASGDLTAWLVHNAEGVRDRDRPAGAPSAHAEFEQLERMGLLTSATVVIHGTALERRDFAAMRAAKGAEGVGPDDGRGAKLAWSPMSNLRLYGRTTDVYGALDAGVLVSLTSDWAPTGSPNLLVELKVADLALRDPEVLGADRSLVPALDPMGAAGRDAAEIALDRELVRMVTTNPARALRWDADLGSIEPGKLADLVVIGRPAATPTGGMPASPYRSLIDATEADVRLTVVGGVALAGDPDLVARFGDGSADTVASADGSIRRAVDVQPEDGRGIGVVSADLDRALGELGGVAGSDGAPLEELSLAKLFSTDDRMLFALAAGRVDAAGLPQVDDPPYRLYPSAAMHVRGNANPVAPERFERRWWRAGPEGASGSTGGSSGSSPRAGSVPSSVQPVPGSTTPPATSGGSAGLVVGAVLVGLLAVAAGLVVLARRRTSSGASP